MRPQISRFQPQPGPAPERPATAAVTRLVLTRFRSYPALTIEVAPAPVVLTGPNGAGKTNLLEALSLLAPGRGLRGARLGEIACRGAEPERGWAVAARLAGAQGTVAIGTGGDAAAARRQIRIDGVAVPGQAALAEHAHLLWLTPAMDRLFIDGASARRRFLDRLVTGVDLGHARRLAAFERCLRARARLLREGRVQPAWLDAVEETMAEHAVAVAAARRDATDRLRPVLGEGARPFPPARLAVVGEVEAWLDDMPAVDAESRLRAALADSRGRDGETGGAAHGPHRSDLEVDHLGKDFPARQCSSGEQKMLLISIILGAARVHALRAGRAPLLLLDEVAAHLDRTHRRALVERICALGAQAWLTGTAPELFADFGPRAQHLIVADGAVTAADPDRPGCR